jgi:hypothetical protein
MSLEVPMIITNFIDFELEERIVRLLSGMGFRIADRKIMSEILIIGDEILVVDEASTARLRADSLPSIVIPEGASQWSDLQLFTYLRHHFTPESDGDSSFDIVITGTDSASRLRTELMVYLNASSLSVANGRFDESDLRLALVPTRRKDELVRLNRFARAKAALFLLAADPKEVERAKVFIEYRTRVHPHLDLGFVVIGGRKSVRSQVMADLQPFRCFLLAGHDDLLRLSFASGRGDHRQRFEQIAEWIGSRHGVARKSDDHLGAPRRWRDRPSLGVGGPMAVAR